MKKNRWIAVPNLSLVVEKSDRVLQIVANSGGELWNVIALERGREAFEHPETQADGIGAHKHVGRYECAADALAAGEAFARAWEAEDTFERAAECACGAR
jgi:hypothetical protein